MKYFKSVILFAALGLMYPMTTTAEVINLATPTTSLVLDAEEGEPLRIVYYGEKLSPVDLDNLKSSPTAHHEAYPV